LLSPADRRLLLLAGPATAFIALSVFS